jgi:hypothetical protein
VPNADLEDLSLEPEGRIVFKYYHYELLYNAIQFYAFVPVPHRKS